MITSKNIPQRFLLVLAVSFFFHSTAAAEQNKPVKPTPPVRSPSGLGAPRFTVVGNPNSSDWTAQPGANPPADRDGDFLIGPDYVPAKELLAEPGVPEGKVQQFEMDSKDSRFYPGIAREASGTVDPANPKTLILHTHPASYKRAVTVYIPAQYKAGTAAPFIITHDAAGIGHPDLPFAHVLDHLIAQRRIPAIVAIMIANGGGDAQGSERGLEYDTMSGKFAEFIETEVLPQVEQRYQIILTKDPDQRAAMGVSSGGAAALAMAWYHPDYYHRVITYSGTFINQQWPFNPETPDGAWGFHESLIRSNAPKPIRLWMEVGDRDLYNPNAMRDGMHDWVDANHRMAAVLKTKGYHYQYVFALNAGHGDRRVREQTLPEALEWVWGAPAELVKK